MTRRVTGHIAAQVPSLAVPTGSSSRLPVEGSKNFQTNNRGQWERLAENGVFYLVHSSSSSATNLSGLIIFLLRQSRRCQLIN